MKKKFCSNCGKSLNVGDSFCNNCGAKVNNIVIEEDIQTKECKYCMKKIDTDATVCPYCRKSQEFSVGRVFIGVIIGMIVLGLIFYFGFVTNNDAPVGVRKVVCELGLRDDYPYCYYVDTEVLDELISK